MTTVLEADDDFAREVLRSVRPVLVVFLASDHAGSRAMRPLVRALELRFKGRLRAVEIDVATHPELVARYQLLTVPTLIFFVAGRDVGRLEGGSALAKKLKAFVSKHLAKL